jgi:hypothetical protein
MREFKPVSEEDTQTLEQELDEEIGLSITIDDQDNLSLLLVLCPQGEVEEEQESQSKQNSDDSDEENEEGGGLAHDPCLSEYGKSQAQFLGHRLYHLITSDEFLNGKYQSLLDQQITEVYQNSNKTKVLRSLQ